MEKVGEFSGLDCSAEAAGEAAKVLRARFDEIVKLRAEALMAVDIEGVHKLRVATRRLRSALGDFAPILRKKPLRNFRKGLKKLADSLGAARDLDVSIAALEKLRSKTENETIGSGLEKLISEKTEQRTRIRPELTETLLLSNIEALQNCFEAALEDAVRVKNRSSSPSFTDAGRQAILKRLDDFCDLGSSLYAPFEIDRLHRFRIAAKRLRYAIELFAPCWGAKILPSAEEVAKMQTFLGEVHDADTWIENLRRQLLENEQEDLPTDLWLLSRFVKIRFRNYRRALKLWKNLETENFTAKLRELISNG